MNNVQLTYATLMALTTQNVMTRGGPNSTSLMLGTVITRNINGGDTVCCYEDIGGGLLRMGNIPTYSGDFFVDINSKMYYVLNNFLIIQDGLNGTIISDTTPAYGFYCNELDGFCAYKLWPNANTWVFLYYEGDSSSAITFSFSSNPRAMGRRNGLIGVCPPNLTSSTFPIYLYSESGNLVNILPAAGGGYYPEVNHVIPINNTHAGVILTGGYGLHTLVGTTFYCYSDINGIVTSWFPFEEYYSPDIYTALYGIFLGRDLSYFYLVNQLHNPENTRELLNEWVIAKFSIDDYDGPIEMLHTTTNPNFINAASKFGHLIKQVTINESTTRNIMNLSNLTVAYSGSTLSTPETMSNIKENDYYLWVVGSGVYLKIVGGWIMYPTTEYPRSEPYGKLGYAIADAKIGTIGTAVELFN